MNVFSESISSTSKSDLCRWLGYGALAVVAETLLGFVSSGLTLGGWPQGGFGLAGIVSLIELVFWGVVLWAFYKVSLHTDAPALRHSAVALFGIHVILELASLCGGDLVLIPALPLYALFVVWFAVAKIRLRRVLGPLAGAVGAAELFGIFFIGLTMAGWTWGAYQANERAGGDEQAAEANFKAVETTYRQRYVVGSSVIHTVWAALTASLFLSYRRRLALDPNAARQVEGGLASETDVRGQQAAAVKSVEKASTREFSVTGFYTGGWLVSGAVLAAVSALLLIVSFPRDALLHQWFWGPHNLGATICAAALVASLILCATSLWRGNACVQIDPDGVTFLDVEQRQTCRWDEVAELYETNLFSIQPNAYDLLTGWARGELHMLTLIDKSGRRLELKKVVNDFPALVALVKRKTLARLLPAAQAAFSGGEPLTFGPITIDRQEVRLGDARLPWAEVDSITVSGGDVKIRPRGKFFAWCAGNLGKVPNAHVLLALARERLKPHQEAGALDRRQGAAEPVASADPPGE